MMRVNLYTDGSARGNPDGPGGYGAILQYTDKNGTLHEREYSAGYVKTTNNRMELMAVIAGLEALNRPCEVSVYSDSAYVTNAFLQNWIGNWHKNGWKGSDKKDVKNKDMWIELLNLTNIHKVVWHKVKGHADNELNNRCDELATGAIKEFRKTI